MRRSQVNEPTTKTMNWFECIFFLVEFCFPLYSLCVFCATIKWVLFMTKWMVNNWTWTWLKWLWIILRGIWPGQANQIKENYKEDIRTDVDSEAAVDITLQCWLLDNGWQKQKRSWTEHLICIQLYWYIVANGRMSANNLIVGFHIMLALFFISVLHDDFVQWINSI